MVDDSEGFVFDDGSRYVGEWKRQENHQDRPHGIGTCFYLDGRRFEGNWENGIPNGEGTLHFPNGKAHGGIWDNGTLTEKKSEIFVNGDIYIGEFKDGFADGEGMLTKAKEKFYKGRLLLTRAKGKIYKGKFSKGKFVSGTFILPNGQEYEIVDYQNQVPISGEINSKLMRKQLGDEENRYQDGKDSEERQKEWIKDKFLDPDIYASEEENVTHFTTKYSDEEVIELAELNPGFGLRRFVKVLYPKAKSPRDYEYDFTMLFDDWKDFSGIDLLNHLEDKKYSKMVNGDEYLKITGEKYLPSGYGRSSSRISSTERKGTPGSGVKVPLKPQIFNWGNLIKESERKYKKNDV